MPMWTANSIWRTLAKQSGNCRVARIVARTETAIRELRSALTNDATAYRAPARLRKNVRAALRREAKSRQQTLSPWLMFATGAAFAGVILGFALFQTTRATEPTQS